MEECGIDMHSSMGGEFNAFFMLGIDHHNGCGVELLVPNVETVSSSWSGYQLS
jgi:hypothetical protein